MAKSLGLRELNQGNIIKVELGNGETLRGCFYGKRIYEERSMGKTLRSVNGNFLVVIDPVKKAPMLVQLEEYVDKKKTTVKGIYATRFTKEVSSYLKKYVLALDKQQKMVLEELKLKEKRKKEDDKLQKMGDELKSIDFEVDGDSVPVDQRAGIVFKNFAQTANKYTTVYSAYEPSCRETEEGYVLNISLGFEATRNVMDTELGVTADFEYDGQYTPTLDNNFDLNKTAINYLGITLADINGLMVYINKLKGVKLRHNRLFSAYPGDYPNDGSLDFEVDVLLDKNVTVKTLEQARDEIVQFISKTKDYRRGRRRY